MARKPLIEAAKRKPAVKAKRPAAAREHLWVKDSATVARVYGISERSLREHFAHGCPGKTPSGYDLLAVGEWRRTRQADLLSDARTERMVEVRVPRLPEHAESGLEGINWRLRRDAAEAQIAELKLADMENRYCLREDADRRAARAFVQLRLQLEAVPQRAALQCPPPVRAAVEADLRELVRRMLANCRRALGDETPLADCAADLIAELDVLPARIAEGIQNGIPEAVAAVAGRSQKAKKAKIEALVGHWVERIRDLLEQMVERRGAEDAENLR